MLDAANADGANEPVGLESGEGGGATGVGREEYVELAHRWVVHQHVRELFYHA